MRFLRFIAVIFLVPLNVVCIAVLPELDKPMPMVVMLPVMAPTSMVASAILSAFLACFASC